MLQVRPATISDLKQILYFIDEAAAWLQTKDIDQWSSPWPDREARDARIERDLQGGRTWMVEDDGIPIATITCRPHGNPALWSESQRADLAVYVSRLIVSRGYAGSGLGVELIDWAGKWARQQYGARWIRIDVWTTNIALHGYYEKQGFRFLKFCEDVDYPSAALFQRATASSEAAHLPRLIQVPDLVKPSEAEDDLGARAIRVGSHARVLTPAKILVLRRHVPGRWTFAMSCKLLARAFACMPGEALLRHYRADTRSPKSRP
jgi:GNAT superfamily N-acetyltransferase